MPWANRELSYDAFRANFMTEQELVQAFGMQDGDEHVLDAETEKELRDQADEYHQGTKAELQAFAEKLGCTLYMAAYLRGLNEKLDVVAVFGSGNVFKRGK